MPFVGVYIENCISGLRRNYVALYRHVCNITFAKWKLLKLEEKESSRTFDANTVDISENFIYL